MLVSYCSSSKLPQTLWFKTTQVHHIVVRNESLRAKIKVSAGLFLLDLLEGGDRFFFFLLFRLLRAVHNLWLTAAFHLHNQQWLTESFTYFILTLTLLYLLSAFGNMCDSIGPTWVIQDTLATLTPSALISFCLVRWHAQGPGIRTLGPLLLCVIIQVKLGDKNILYSLGDPEIIYIWNASPSL